MKPMNIPRPTQRQAGLSILEVLIASLILAAILAITFSILASSSAHVETTQITLKLESDAREALNLIIKDLRESKFSFVRTGSLTELKGGAASAVIVADGKIHPGIEFRLPGLKTDLEAYGKGADRIFTRKVSYYWELDVNEKSGVANKDDDNNGLTDEGVLVKREMMVDGTGAEISTTLFPTPKYTRICSNLMTVDLTKTEFGLEFSAPPPLGTPPPLPSTISIKLRLEKTNPKNRKLPTLTKTVEGSVDLRN